MTGLATKLNTLRSRRRPQRSRAAAGAASTDYAIIDRDRAQSLAATGWCDRDVVARQDASYQLLLEQMRAGQPRCDLAGVADAVRRTALGQPSVLEVGCGSGYYADVLNHLLDGAIDYTGVDYSPAMIAMARRCRPDHSFGVADATRLPFADGGFDVVLNGVSLMHIYRYEAAITETARVADQWCILHSVPILERRATTFLTKQAYGQLTVEVIFNRDELIDLVRKAGFRLAHDQPSIAYDLEPVLGEHTQTRTYLCKRAGI